MHDQCFEEELKLSATIPEAQRAVHSLTSDSVDCILRDLWVRLHRIEFRF